MSTGARMAAYAEYLATYNGLRAPHKLGVTLGCVGNDHCHIHHVDEPENGDTYRTCGECGHVFVTEMDLQTADVSIRTRIWQSALAVGDGPLDHSGAPVSKPGKDIDSCPLCTHSF